MIAYDDTVHDILNLTDQVSVHRTIYRDVTENVGLEDTTTGWKNFTGIVTDALAATDTGSASAWLAFGLVETLYITEALDYRLPQVLLYPVETVLWSSALEHISTALSGCLTVIPFNFTDKMEIVVTQTGFTQDYSLRVWVSDQRNGLPIGRDWIANKMPDQKRVLYSAAMLPPTGVGILLEDGNYYINILNQTAASTTFSLMATTLS